MSTMLTNWQEIVASAAPNTSRENTATKRTSKIAFKTTVTKTITIGTVELPAPLSIAAIQLYV